MSGWVGINEMCTGILDFKIIKSLKWQEAENVWSSIKTDESQRNRLIKVIFREQINMLEGIITFCDACGEKVLGHSRIWSRRGNVDPRSLIILEFCWFGFYLLEKITIFLINEIKNFLKENLVKPVQSNSTADLRAGIDPCSKVWWFLWAYFAIVKQNTTSGQ